MKGLFRGMKFAIWILAFTALLVEVLLQAGALVVYLVNSQKAPPSQQTQGKTVLCVGDSWTHGMGSTDSSKNSYPAVLEQLLRDKESPDWRVFNGGQSGQNSRDVLLRLPSQLEESRPSIVCVLIGRNDRWSTPQLVVSDTAAERHTGYRFRWRLPRLFAWILESARPQPADLKTDGPEWQSRNEPYPSAYNDAPWPWPKQADSLQFRKKGWERFNNNDTTAAISEFEKCLKVSADPEVCGALCNLYLRAGLLDKSKTFLEWLQAEWGKTKSYWVGRQLMSSLASWSRDADTLAVCQEYVKLFPKDPIGWGEMGRAQFNLGQNAAANTSLEKCFEGYKAASYFVTLRWKVAIQLQKPDQAIRSIYEGYAANNDLAWIRAEFNSLTEHEHLTNELFRDVLASFDCESSVRQRLSLLVEEAIRARDGAAAKRVLMNHLGQIVSRCRASNATPVLLEYPIMQAYHGALAEAAEDLGVEHIDVYSMFRKRFSEAEIHAMRSPDGHVNDAGYRIMSECVFEGLQPVLQSLK